MECFAPTSGCNELASGSEILRGTGKQNDGECAMHVGYEQEGTHMQRIKQEM